MKLGEEYTCKVHNNTQHEDFVKMCNQSFHIYWAKKETPYIKKKQQKHCVLNESYKLSFAIYALLFLPVAHSSHCFI